ncbi:MAG: phytoene desaturase family protein, partial [Mycobacteriales bacterium]
MSNVSAASDVTDAIVIGAGPNGLVAANILADAGWSVGVLEAAEEPGGGVRSGRYVHQDYVSDYCSAFYPFTAVSRPIAALNLAEYGLRWRHAPVPLAHPLPDGRAAILGADPDATCASLDRLAAGDGAAWQRLHGLWQRLREPLLDAIFTPFPPVRAGTRIARRLGPKGLLRFARFALLPVRRLLEEEFSGPGGLLIAGSSLHTDLSPESATSAVYGWLLAMIAQDDGFPVPEGGASAITAALVRRLESRGGWVRCGSAAAAVIVRNSRAVGVRSVDGVEHPARLAVLAAV